MRRRGAGGTRSGHRAAGDGLGVGSAARRRRRRWESCSTTRPASSRPPTSGPRARLGPSGTSRTAAPGATGCSASRSSCPRPATSTRTAQDRVLLSVRQAGHRGLARRPERRGRTRQAGLAAAHRRRWIVRRADLRLDRRRSDLRAVQAAGGALSAGLGSGARPSAGRRLRQLQDHRVGACRTGWVPTSGSTTGDRRGRSPTRPRICIRSRSTSGPSGALGSTSTTFSSPDSGSGTKPYRLVSMVSKLSLMAGAADKTILVKLSTSERLDVPAERPENFT